MKKGFKLGFTLAEVMIVLTVIGVLAGILIPVANNARPDEKVMKFKKANATLSNVIHELVTSDKYYCKGDLGKKADCTTQLVNDDYTGSYFCQTFADLLSTKEVNCRQKGDGRATDASWLLSNESIYNIATGSAIKRTVTADTIAATKAKFDSVCKTAGKIVGAEIITTDNITFYQTGVSQFGSQSIAPNAINGLSANISLRFFSPPDQFPANYADQNGFDMSYKIYCIDVDGIPSNATESDCVNECPFGYGIRADGKILPGARADEWLAKDFQKGKNDN